MKKQILATPVLMTAALASLIASSLSCGKTSSIDKPTGGANSSATEKPAAGTNGTVSGEGVTNWTTPAPGINTNLAATGDNVSNSTVTEAVATNQAAPQMPATPELAPTAPQVKPVIQVVEMPTNPPAAPQKFYPASFGTNGCPFLGNNPNYYFRLRAGYEHTYRGDNNDTWYAGLKFYAYQDDVRANVGNNGWLIPDADVEFSHRDLAKTDKGNSNSGSAQGLNLRASVYWPWARWTTSALVRENCPSPYAQPLTFTLGPTANAGFDFLFEDGNARFARYMGARVTINRNAFVEYTVGATDGLHATRQQVLAELPFYVTHDHQVSYVFRGLWNHGDSTPDVLQAGVFLEMPLGLFGHPSEWGDLIPFVR